MKKLISSINTWSHTPTGDGILVALLYLAALIALFSLPLWA